ncbi:MAG: hypothetical protein K2M55_07200 [Muribaculaceae bacterium]|nr:hypothetical protein [Muribaculaceae bacterium]
MNHLLLLDTLRRCYDACGSYDPVSGLGAAGERVKALSPGGDTVYIPATMCADPAYRTGLPTLEWQRLRCRHDFEYWCATCVTIKDKLRGCNTRFILNKPQRRLAAILEADRAAGQPMRIIMLKARQWGGSALCHLLIYLNLTEYQQITLLLKIINKKSQ